MSADPNKKSARTFQCRDVLWETFDQMARELECSVDYLVNEAMKQYARQRSQGAGRSPDRAGEASQPSEGLAPPMPGPSVAASVPMELPAALRPPARHAMAPPLPPPPGRVAPPPPAGRSSAPSRSAAPPPFNRPPSATLPPIPRSMATPAPVRAPPPPVMSPPRATPPPLVNTNGLPPPPPQSSTLTLIYNGERHAITKDRFIIGRGKQSSDLMLKDPNVSRQHAAVEFQNGAYFMVDMQSTNGVAFNGERVDRQHIAEGDTFRICDHDLIFTYR